MAFDSGLQTHWTSDFELSLLTAQSHRAAEGDEIDGGVAFAVGSDHATGGEQDGA